MSKIYAICFLLLFSLASCTAEYPEIVTVKSLRLTGYNPLSKTLKLTYNPVVHNPNAVDIWVDEVETEIIFDGASLGTTSSEERIELAANKDSEFSLDQKIKVDQFIKQLRTAMNKDSIEISLEGKYTFKAAEMDLTIPYTYTTYVNPKKDLARLLLGL